MSTASRKVSVAILSWNGRHHLELLLPALAAQLDPGVAWETLVLDNGSSDGSVDWVRSHHPEVRLIESPVNLGFCAGNNRLVEQASGDAVALLNNDTRPRADWLAALVAALAAAPDDVAAVSGLILDWQGERLDFARGVMTFDSHAFQYGFKRPLASAEIPPDGAELPFACGGNMLVRRASFLAAGGFDEDYFAYLEDVDLGWRLWSGGERVLFARDAVVHHRSGATSDLLGVYNRGFLFERNAFLTAYKNYDDEHWPRLMPAILLTLGHRTQTLLEQNNLGGEQLAVDPYAGHIADTGRPAGSADGPPPAPHVGEGVIDGLARRWRQYGPRDLARRGVGKAVGELRRGLRRLSGRPLAIPPPQLTDPRSVAQLRAWSWLIRNLDPAAEKRRAVQARRRRPDAEILARFPLYVVPTYPGDESLFTSSAFRHWLADDLPLVRCGLDEVMQPDGPA